MAIKEEFTWKEMNKIIDSQYDELMLEMSNDQAVEVLDREYNIIYIDDIIEGKLKASMIFKTQKSIKMDNIAKEARSGITNPHKQGKISFSES